MLGLIANRCLIIKNTPWCSKIIITFYTFASKAQVYQFLTCKKVLHWILKWRNLNIKYLNNLFIHFSLLRILWPINKQYCTKIFLIWPSRLAHNTNSISCRFSLFYFFSVSYIQWLENEHVYGADRTLNKYEYFISFK